VLLLRDVTVRHRQLSQLQAFAGVVAHDLQNPLFASKGWAEVAAEGLGDAPEGVGPHVREALRRTISSLGRAQLLVNDLLGFTRASTETVDVRTLDLDALVEGEMAELRVRYHCPDAVLEKGELGSVRMDPTLARQLFANLLGNALKYAEDGVVPRIRVGLTREAAGVRVDVTDNGPGIPEEHRERVFEAFHRVRPEVPGTGLGLAICAEAVHRHGGTIRVDEGPGGRGCTFSVHLPRGASAGEG
jgi:signal transduction histidine kinase